MLATFDVQAALGRAVAFLERKQFGTGEIPVFASSDPDMISGCVGDPCVFPTALAAHSLSFCPAASSICDRAHRFLLGEVDRHGLWRHWTRAHPHHSILPPDLDDTGCASAVLSRAGIDFPNNRALLLSNRTGRGCFYTWVAPRFRWTGRVHMAITMAQLRRAPALLAFFRATSAKAHDVDACVNANMLFYLGDFPGRDAVVTHLRAVLRQGQESVCDKWYENPFVVRYLFSRALVRVAPEAGALLCQRTADAAPTNGLEHALSAATLLDWKRDVEHHIRALLALQNGDGSWPRAAVYHGGRARLRRGGFAARHPDTPHWGSEALTTAFAIEALARWRTATPQ